MLKKILRDLWKHKSRSFPIIILILSTQMASVLYIELGIILEDSWTHYTEETEVGDVWVDTFLMDSSVFNDSIVEEWNKKYLIKKIQPRLFFKGHLTVNNENIPVDILSFPGKGEAAVNKIITTDGSYFTDHSEIMNGIYLEQSYVEFYKLEGLTEVDLTINLQSGYKNFSLEVLGGAYSPEYPIRPGDTATQFENSATFEQYLIMSTFLRTDFLQSEMFSNQTIFNQICISLEKKDDLQTFLNYLQSDDSPLSSRYIIDVRKYPELMEANYIAMIGVGWGIALFFLIITVFLTYTVVNRFIDEERAQIGVLKAIGYSNNFLISRNLFYGLIMGSIGSILGVLLGSGVGIIISDLGIISWVAIPYLVIDFPFQTYLLMILITILCSLFACYIAVKRITRIPPQAAIRPTVVERRITIFIVERILQKLLRIKLSVPNRYSIRNVFTNPKRTLTTIVTLLLAVTIVGGVFTIVTSIFNGGELLFQSEAYDAQIYLTNPQEFNEVKLDVLETLGIQENVEVEPILIDFAKIKLEGVWTKITFQAIASNPSLKILEGAESGFQNNYSIIISPDLANQLNLQAGNTYELLGQNNTQITVNVQIELPQHHVAKFYIPLSLGNYLSFGNQTAELVNGILLKCTVLSDTHIEAITDIPYVSTVFLKIDLIGQINTWYLTIVSVLVGMFVIVLFIAGIIIYSIMSISIAERKDDFAIMKAVGINNGNIYVMSFLETLFYSSAASIGYFVGFIIAEWYMGFLQSFMQSPMGDFELSIIYYVLTFLFGFVAALMGQFMATRQILKQTIAEVTKQKLFG